MFNDMATFLGSSRYIVPENMFSDVYGIQYPSQQVEMQMQEYEASRKQLFEELQKTMQERTGVYTHQQGAPPEPKGYKCSYCGSLFKENPNKCPNCGGSEIKESL